jgi:hypothetical protein
MWAAIGGSLGKDLGFWAPLPSQWWEKKARQAESSTVEKETFNVTRKDFIKRSER